MLLFFFSLKWCSMIDSDSPFPQAIPALAADCCEAAAIFQEAGVIASPRF
jgi:hypothetical protein